MTVSDNPLYKSVHQVRYSQHIQPQSYSNTPQMVCTDVISNNMISSLSKQYFTLSVFTCMHSQPDSAGAADTEGIYWTPSSDAIQLYQQISSGKFTHISRDQIKWVCWTVGCCVHVCFMHVHTNIHEIYKYICFLHERQWQLVLRRKRGMRARRNWRPRTFYPGSHRHSPQGCNDILILP